MVKHLCASGAGKQAMARPDYFRAGAGLSQAAVSPGEHFPAAMAFLRGATLLGLALLGLTTQAVGAVEGKTWLTDSLATAPTDRSTGKSACLREPDLFF